MAESVNNPMESGPAPENGAEELFRIRLPLTKELQNDVFVRVNHRTWLIKRGESVEVPACVVEVLEHADQATAESLQFQAAHEMER